MNKELEEVIKQYRELETNKDIIKNIDKDYLFKFSDIVLNYIENSISKEKVEKVIEKINRYEDTAGEQIEERIVIADSDSLNFGRKQAHRKDIEELKELLEGR